METRTFEISEVVGAGWEYAKKHGILLAVVLLVTSIIGELISNILGPSNAGYNVGQELGARIAQGDPEALAEFANTLSSSSAGSLLSSIIQLIASVGLYVFVMGVVKGNVQSLEFDTFKQPLNTYLKFIVVSILEGIIVLIGTCCCILPGIFLATRLFLAPLRVIDNPEGGIIEALSDSWKMTQGNTFTVFLLFVVECLLCIAGLLCCCVGIYFVSAMFMFVNAIIYFTLLPNLVSATTNSEGGYMK